MAGGARVLGARGKTVHGLGSGWEVCSRLPATQRGWEGGGRTNLGKEQMRQGHPRLGLLTPVLLTMSMPPRWWGKRGEESVGDNKAHGNSATHFKERKKHLGIFCRPHSMM